MKLPQINFWTSLALRLVEWLAFHSVDNCNRLATYNNISYLQDYVAFLSPLSMKTAPALQIFKKLKSEIIFQEKYCLIFMNLFLSSHS
jgi:hypothetical protein